MEQFSATPVIEASRNISSSISICFAFQLELCFCFGTDSESTTSSSFVILLSENATPYYCVSLRTKLLISVEDTSDANSFIAVFLGTFIIICLVFII